MAQLVKNPPAMWETWVRSLGWEDPRRREWLGTPVSWPGEFHGLYSSWGRKESDKVSDFHFVTPVRWQTGPWAGFPRSPTELQLLLKTGERRGCGGLRFYFLPFFFPNSLSLPQSHFSVPRTVLHPTRVPGSSMALRTQEGSAHLISRHPLLLSRLPHDPMHAALSSLLMLCSSISKCFQISCSFQPLSLCARCSLCLEYTLVGSYSSASPSCNFLQEVPASRLFS